MHAGSEESDTPSLVHVWCGHTHGVTSMQIVEKRLTESDMASIAANGTNDSTTLTLILSASTDKTARLWTLAGKLIGTFGQNAPWQIGQPDTYASTRVHFSDA